MARISRTAAGFTPFTNPYPPTYQGQPVSLYPNGNARPAEHEKLGLRQAAGIMARNLAGNPDPNGKVVLLSAGMPDSQEFTEFLSLIQADTLKDPRVQAVDGAVDGRTAASIVAEPDTYWSAVEQRLQSAQAADGQVQALWLEESDAGPHMPFPDHAQLLESELKTIVRQAQARFPNLKVAYVSSPIYAGYAGTSLSPEPYAYETAFAMKWLIERQIDGAPELDAASGAFPWLAWSPYPWADGPTPRIDGLTWACADFQADGALPSPSGRRKVAGMLLDFLHSDSTARTWYLAPHEDPVPAIGAVVNSAGWSKPVATGSLAARRPRRRRCPSGSGRRGSMCWTA